MMKSRKLSLNYSVKRKSSEVNSPSNECVSSPRCFSSTASPKREHSWSYQLCSIIDVCVSWSFQLAKSLKTERQKITQWRACWSAPAFCLCCPCELPNPCGAKVRSRLFTMSVLRERLSITLLVSITFRRQPVKLTHCNNELKNLWKVDSVIGISVNNVQYLIKRFNRFQYFVN